MDPPQILPLALSTFISPFLPLSEAVLKFFFLECLYQLSPKPVNAASEQQKGSLTPA